MMLRRMSSQSVVLVLRERWAVDDPFLDFLQFMHDKAMYEAMRGNP